MTGRGTRLISGFGLTLAVGCFCVTGAAASSSTSGGITYVTKERKVKAGHYSAPKVKCPGSTHVLGGGEDSNAPFAQLRLRHTFPIDGKDRGRTPDDGWGVGVSAYTNNRKLSVTAICAKLKPHYAHTSPTASASTQSGEYNVVCEGGEQVLSGGTKGAKALSENSGFPEGEDAWGFYIDNQAPADLDVKAYAVCADINTRIVTADDTAPPNNFDTAQASCPQHKHVVGGGQANDAGYNSIAANRMTPVGDGGWLASVDNYTMATQFDYTAYAICVGALG